MAIYTYITYQACCDGCYKEYGKFSSVEEAQQAVKNDKEWKVINGKAYCPECIINPPHEYTQEEIVEIYNKIKNILKEENNEE